MHFITPKKLTFLIPVLISVSSYSQGIKGRLTDSKGSPVPFVAVYDETTSAGTTANDEGYYELKLESGEHRIVYKAFGYHLIQKQVTISNQIVTLDIQLREQPFEIKEVVITPGKEDPAYAIMRRVIGLAPYHLNLVEEYIAEVYLKGTIHIIKIPKLISRNIEIDGKKNLIKNGDVYLDESLNQIEFHAPDNYEQKVISFHNTYPLTINQVSPAWLIRSSLYEPEFEDIISPLAPKAFNYYTYRYEGFFTEGKNTIFKISVIPRHNSQQLMKGTIYIVDKLWCLHSVDASVQMFYGTIGFKALYSPVQSDAWLPISYRFHIDADIMGVKGNYNYSSSVKFKHLILNKGTALTPATVNKPGPGTVKQKNQQKIETLLSKEELTNRDMVKLSALMSEETSVDSSKSNSLEIKDPGNKVIIEKNALRKDTAYWNTMRPIPLTTIESKIPGLNDSTAITSKDTLMKKDSVVVMAGNNRGKLSAFILSGKGFRVFNSTLNIHYDGVVGLKKFDFNTVDGFIYRQTFRVEQTIDSTHKLRINPGLAYTFSRKRIMWWTDINYDYAPFRGGSVHFHMGSESADYNAESGINANINSIASLFFRRNYLKLYQQNQVYLSNKIDLANGLNLKATLGYRTSQPLVNHTGYSFFYRTEREYSFNIPDNDPLKVARNIYNEEAYWDVFLEYTPRYYYRLSGTKKQYQHSRFPTFYVRNKMAIPGIVHSNADYDLLEIGAKQFKQWGMMHSFAWNIKGGFYLNRNRIFLMDDKYFNNQDIPVVIGNLNEAFNLLPYYRNSTSRNFAEIHATYTTPYLLIKYLPFLSNKVWLENICFNYLTTSTQKNYWEAGYSLSNIYLAGSIGVFAGFKGTSYQTWGVKVSINL